MINYRQLLTVLAICTLSAEENEYCCLPRASHVDVRHLEYQGIGFNEGYTSLDLFLSNADPYNFNHLFFFDLRGHVFNSGRPAANIGAGWRYLFDANCHALGVNTYYDYRKTKRKSFNQMGVGVEYLTPEWEFRANGYIPFGSKVSNHYDLNFAGFTGNQFLVSRKYEYAMSGADAEIGWHFTHFKNIDLSASVGPYYFKGHFEKAAIGAKARIVARLTPYVTVEVGDSYDSVFHNRFHSEVTLSLPFGPRPKPCRPCCCERESMIVQWVHDAPRRGEIVVVDSKKKKSPGIDPATGLPYFFLFVNNTSSSNGTIESPYPTLAQAESASNPGDVIYVFPGDGTSNGMNAGIILKDNQRFLGSGVSHGFATNFGQVSIPPQSSISPTITNAGTVVTLGLNNEVSGFWIIGGSSGISNGASWNGAATIANINRNWINATAGAMGAAINLTPNGTQGNIYIFENQIENPANIGIQIANTSSSAASIIIQDNFISNSGSHNVLVSADTGSVVNASVVGNTLYLHSDNPALLSGVYMRTLDNATFTSNIYQNFIAGGRLQANQGSFGILIEAADTMSPSSRTNAAIGKNTITLGSILLNTAANSQGSISLNVYKNEMINSFIPPVASVHSAISIQQDGAGAVSGTIFQNQISNLNTTGGIELFTSTNAASFDLQIESNIVSDCLSNGGILTNCANGASGRINVLNNQVSGIGAGFPAIWVISDGSLRAQITNNNSFENADADYLIQTGMGASVCAKLEGNKSQNGYTLHNFGGTFQLEPLTNNSGGFSYSGVITNVPASTCD